jgi:hypothetical protein
MAMARSSVRVAVRRGRDRASGLVTPNVESENPMVVNAETLRALRDKYLEIRRLRDDAAAGQGGDPRREMAVLASRFPGALRECDELPIDEIERRLGVLQRALEEREPAPEWVALQIGYHGFMRAALRIKRMAAGRGAADAAAVLRELAQSYRPAPDEPPLADFDEAAIVAILEPSDGRLNPWVYERVAAQHGVPPARVRLALFSR